MADVDKLVEEWFIKKWTKPNEGMWFRMIPSYSPVEHGEPDELKVVACKGEWECSCWSSWTREDTQEYTFHVKTKAGEIAIAAQGWGLPAIIEDLIPMENTLEDVCSIENRIEDYEQEW